MNTNGNPKLKTTIAALAFGCALLLAGASAAGEFTISPTSMKVWAPAQTAELTVATGARSQAVGQVRVMRWTRSGGRDVLTTTRDVVASPPVLRMAPNRETTIRLVRTSKAPVRGKECYRILVDQLPQTGGKGAQVAFTIRHSVPLCFENRG
ncbi:molecular chaperone [Halovulum dunhuangense]|uniref:Molecular chaperone n=1 Tax=Halovulum dunhuangense TaxID=1505036 RepID=A0A849L7B4_9RHOB|nr:fimbria/pilus periplasmic chaperone [Halovulum dunhuangense]NNU82034.1 molecular chaperone [Halovulum dunhuangense]